jgi:hypothetical protein
MGDRSLLKAAFDAADRGWSVFPLVPGWKVPAIRGWEEQASTDRRRIFRWWVKNLRMNVGIAAGKSGLLVIDLDQAGGDAPPPRFAGAGNGRDVLALLAAEAGAEMPTDTYTVATPGGSHLYFRAPVGLNCRNSVGALGWKIDSRCHGGYVVGAGSQRPEGSYRVTRPSPVAELPGWLLEALTPPPVAVHDPGRLPPKRASAYVRAIVEGEAHDVATARTGTRHRSLLKAARTLGRLVGGGELGEADARDALLDAARGHLGVDGFAEAELIRTVEDGITYGIQLPRRIRRDCT